MKKKKHITDISYFRNKLSVYIKERHPHFQPKKVERLLDIRGLTAVKTYEAAIVGGDNVATALGKADKMLYEGLIFSKFDTV